MNIEPESEPTEITRSCGSGQVQGIPPAEEVHIGLANLRVVAHDHEPPRLAPADAAFETGVIR